MGEGEGEERRECMHQSPRIPSEFWAIVYCHQDLFSSDAGCLLIKLQIIQPLFVINMSFLFCKTMSMCTRHKVIIVMVILHNLG